MASVHESLYFNPMMTNGVVHANVFGIKDCVTPYKMALLVLLSELGRAGAQLSLLERRRLNRLLLPLLQVGGAVGRLRRGQARGGEGAVGLGRGLPQVERVGLPPGNRGCLGSVWAAPVRGPREKEAASVSRAWILLTDLREGGYPQVREDGEGLSPDKGWGFCCRREPYTVLPAPRLGQACVWYWARGMLLL